MNKLAEKVDSYISDNGIKKTWIADKMGISQQLLNGLLNKKNFTVDDANRILETMGQQITVDIKPLPKPEPRSPVKPLTSPIYNLDEKNTEK